MRRKSPIGAELDKFKKGLLSTKKKDLRKPIPTESLFRLAKALGYDKYTEDHAHWVDMLDDPSWFKLILEPVGTFKSTTAIIYCVREIIRNPNVTIAYFSKSRDIPAETAGVVRNHLEQLGYKPKVGWTLTKFSVSNRDSSIREPTFRALSINSRFTGIHPDIIVTDDIVGLEDFRSAKERSRVKDQYNALLPRMKENSRLVMIGTRWHHDDLYAGLIENQSKNGFKVWVTPAINKDGSARYPSILPIERLDTLRNQSPLRIMYNSQYLLDPTPTDEQVFTGELTYYDSDDVRFLQGSKTFRAGDTTMYPVAYIDPSTTVGQDDVAMVFGLVNDQTDKLHVHDVWIGQLSADQVIGRLKKWYDQGLKLCYVEITGNQLHYLRLLKQVKGDSFGVVLAEWKNNGKKELRIATFAYHANNGNVMFSKGLQGSPSFEVLKRQMMDFPSGAKDDGIDALESLHAISRKYVKMF